MPIDKPLAAEGNPDALRNVESFHAPTDHVSSSIQAQLSHPSDIASANQFFKPTGTEQFLPTVGNVGPTGIEMHAVAPGPHFAAPPMTGLETHGLQAMAMPPGGEMAALSGAPGMIPGAEPLSPLINMIMKMPGHIGLASSFFEALGAFFAPATEMLGNLAEGFDLGSLFEGAGDAADSLGSALEAGGDGAVDLSLLPTDAPIFDQLGEGAGAGDFAQSGLHMDVRGNALGGGAPDLTDSFASSPRLEVGGGPSHPMFEMGPGQGLNFENNNYLAMEPNQGFGATTGNFNAPPQPMPAPTSAQPTVDWHRDAINSSRGQLLGDTAGSAAQGGESHMQAGDNQVADGSDHSTATEAPQHTTYTVHKGDNLWDIAHSHLGDGTRWEEIYDLNKSVLGDNPRLIMPGTELQLPGGDSIADGSLGHTDYTVQAGDNLWDISKDHLGGGQNWHELYQNNEGVVGSNPDMIHPGQHLQLDGASGATHGHAAGHDVGHSLAHNHSPAHAGEHHLAHHGPAHGGAHAAGHHGVAHHGDTNIAHANTPHADSGNPQSNVSQANPNHTQAGAAQHAPAARIAGSGSNMQPSSGGELQAKAQSLSSIHTYGDGAVHDSATSVPSPQL